MADFELLKELVSANQSKIVLLVMDGLGGLPHNLNGPTELEFAQTPNLDRLAVEGNLGLSQPAGAGVTPGSGPGHLGLFGYDPLKYVIGRGVLESVGIGFELGPDDVAARGNFCTVDADGVITDRRAGRIPTSKCVELVEKLRPITLPGVEVFRRAGAGLSVLCDLARQGTGRPYRRYRSAKESAAAASRSARPGGRENRRTI